jgi:hypothetical protein
MNRDSSTNALLQNLDELFNMKEEFQTVSPAK